MNSRLVTERVRARKCIGLRIQIFSGWRFPMNTGDDDLILIEIARET